MRLTKAAFAILCLAPLGVLGQAPRPSITLTSKDGRMELTNFTSSSLRLTGPKSVHFKIVGDKILGTWTDPDLKITAKVIEGDADRIGTGLQLRQAVLTGGVRVVSVRSNRTVTADSPSAEIRFDGEIAHIDMKGGVEIDSQAPETGETLHLTGSSGTMEVNKTNAMGKATLLGPVKIDMKRRSSESAPIDLVAHCDRLDVDTTATPSPSITLTGNVSVQGNDPVLAADVRATSAVILLDANMQPIEIDAEGIPGVMRVKERAKGGA